MKLVLQCAMCGTQHPVGTLACCACRTSGVTQLRLMFECQTCGRLDLHPVCERCPAPGQPGAPVYELDDDLIVAEEIVDDPIAVELEEEDAAHVVDESGSDFDIDLVELEDEFEYEELDEEE